MKARKNILVIAGFDPSGGAGVLADVKTLEQHKVLGFAVPTANTIQTEDAFIAINWIDDELLFEQLSTLLKRYKFDGVKFGLIKNVAFLKQALDVIFEVQNQYFKSKPMIVWDPVLSASAGDAFHQNLDGLTEVLRKVDYLTPNWVESEVLSGTPGLIGASELANYCSVYLKGGHNHEELGKDYLVTITETIPFKMKIEGKAKHGSGCIFSSALTANLVNHYPIKKACLRAKRYIETRLASNPTLLAYHKS